MSGCQGLGEGQWGMIVNRSRFLPVKKMFCNKYILFSLILLWTPGLALVWRNPTFPTSILNSLCYTILVGLWEVSRKEWSEEQRAKNNPKLEVPPHHPQVCLVPITWMAIVHSALRSRIPTYSLKRNCKNPMQSWVNNLSVYLLKSRTP